MKHVAVIVPTLNEGLHIEDLLVQVLAEPVGRVLVVDGGSSDETRSVVTRLSALDQRLALINNDERIQSAGVNLAARSTDAAISVLVRLDAHARYPAQFVEKSVSVLQETGADSVVVRLKTTGDSCFQKAVAAVSNSAFGTGGAAHRTGGESRWIDHGHHAAFKRASFQRAGGYDRTFKANEDAEFDVRLRRSGGRIWFASQLEIGYFPRRTPIALGLQYFRYGAGRAETLLKHGERPRPRQLAPPLILLVVLGGILLAPLSLFTLLGPAAYFAGVLGATSLLLVRARDPCVAGAMVALPTMHLSWAAGFVSTLLRSFFKAARPDTRTPDVEVAEPVAR